MEWYKEVVFRKYAQFEGRAHRTEYWNFFLFNVLIYLGIGVVESFIGLGGLASGLYALAVLVPGVAAAMRRLHDTGRAGWWVLLVLLPLVGAIALLVLLALEGEPGPNAYGEGPSRVTV